MPYDGLRSVRKEPWQVMEAWRDVRMVGFTALAVRDEANRSLNTWMTVVDHEIRGPGPATALKTSQALAVRDVGGPSSPRAWRATTPTWPATGPSGSSRHSGCGT